MLLLNNTGACYSSTNEHVRRILTCSKSEVGSRLIALKLVKTALEGHDEERQVLESIGQCLALCRATWPLLALPYPAPRASASRFPHPLYQTPHWAPVCRACGVEGRPRFPSATSLPAATAATEAPTPLAPSRALSYVLRCSVLCGQDRDRWQRFIKGHARSLASCPCIVLRIYCAFVCHPTPCAYLS